MTGCRYHQEVPVPHQLENGLSLIVLTIRMDFHSAIFEFFALLSDRQQLSQVQDRQFTHNASHR